MHQNHLTCHRTLKRITLQFGNTQTLPRLLSDKWSSIRSRDPWWPLCIFKGLSSLSRKHRCPIPFVSAILAISETWSSVSPYLVQYRYWHCHLVILDIPSPWTSHMLQHWMKSHRVGPKYLSVMRKNKYRSWCICLNILHWKTQKHLFSHPVKEETVDAIKASTGSSD
jgi:hypothetical protein